MLVRSFVIAAFVATIGFVGAHAQQAATLQPPTAASPREAYVPDLSDIMETTQLRHFKLGFAGLAKNWPLASYELQQITKSFDNAAKLYPQFGQLAQAKLISDVSTPALNEVGDAIKAHDSTAFSRAFAKLTTACNGCHQAAGVGFIAIRVPTASPFSNQSFAPNHD